MKRFLALILIICTVFGAVCTASVSASGKDDGDFALCVNLGIIPYSEDWQTGAGVTRSQMAALIARFLGSGDALPVATVFSDVTAENPYSGYIDFIYSCGIASLNETKTYYPDRYVSYNEVIKMVISALGGDEIAKANGGYPNGYLTVASSLKLLSDVNFQVVPSLADISTILVNALTAPIYKVQSYAIKNGEIIKAGIEQTKDETVLNTYLNVSVMNVNIKDENALKKSVNVKILSIKKKTEDFTYNTGESCTLFLSDMVKNGNLKYIDAEIWVKGEDEIIYAEPLKNVEIIWGAIDEVNKESETGKTYDIRYIDTIALKGGDDYIDVSENCRFSENGREVVSGGIEPVGNFVRIVLTNDEITSMEIWHLTEGGVITSTSEGLVYSKGIQYDIHLKEFDEAKNVNVIINNKFSEKILLTNGVVFDWFYDKEKDELMVVTSGYSVTDEFSGVTNSNGAVDGVIIGKDTYDVSEKFGLYCKNDGDYFGNVDVRSLLGQTVTAYIDYNGDARYLEVFSPAANSNEFYGIVLGYQASEMEDDKIRIARVVGDKVDEIECVMSEKVSFPNGVNIASVLSDIANAQDKVDAMKRANVLYKFKVNANNKVIGIESPTRHDACSASGESSISSISGGANPRIYSPRIYFESDTVFCAYYLHEDEVKVKAVYTSAVAGRRFSGCRFDIFSKGDTSQVEFVLLRGSVEKICDMTEETDVNYGLLTENMKSIDPQTGKEGRMVRINGSDYFMEGTSADNLPSAGLVTFGKNPVFCDNKICIEGTVYSLEGKPENWSILSNGEGLREDIIERVDGKRLYFESGNKIYLSNNAKYYKRLDSGNYIPASKSDLRTGEHIYFLYKYSEIQIVIIG